MRPVARGALAGVAAAAAWAAVEPALARAVGTDYTDARLLGRLVRPTGVGWRVAGWAVHAANGAAFGAAFAALGLRGPRAGLLAAQAENLLAWPGMAVMDRVHPDRRSGRWPRLLTDRRVLVQETLAHALFGVVLGALLPAELS
jgi:hypothetical protein